MNRADHPASEEAQQIFNGLSYNPWQNKKEKKKRDGLIALTKRFSRYHLIHENEIMNKTHLNC